jgi:hypothetical protein
MVTTILAVANTLLTALAGVNWGSLFPSFSGLIAALLQMLEAGLGFLSVSQTPAIAKA